MPQIEALLCYELPAYLRYERAAKLNWAFGFELNGEGQERIKGKQQTQNLPRTELFIRDCLSLRYQDAVVLGPIHEMCRMCNFVFP